MVTCPRCGRSNEGKYRFCLGCGAALASHALRQTGTAAPIVPPAVVPAGGSPQRLAGAEPTTAPVAPEARARPASTAVPPAIADALTQDRPAGLAPRGDDAQTLAIATPRSPSGVQAAPQPLRRSAALRTAQPAGPASVAGAAKAVELPPRTASQPVPIGGRLPASAPTSEEAPTAALTPIRLDGGTARRPSNPPSIAPRPAESATKSPGVDVFSKPSTATPPRRAPSTRTRKVTGESDIHITDERPAVEPFAGGDPPDDSPREIPEPLRPAAKIPTDKAKLEPPPVARYSQPVPPPGVRVSGTNPPQPSPRPVPAPPPPGQPVCPTCRAPVPTSNAFCGSCGATNPFHTPTLPMPQSMAKTERLGYVALIDDNGVESIQFPLNSGESKIGRGESCQIRFPDDGFLAKVHCAVDAEVGRLTLRPMDFANGVFLRITTPVEVHHGDVVRVGQEVLRFERVDRLAAEVNADGLTEAVGWQPPRGVWGRLCQLGLGRQVANAYLLAAPDVFLGRERGDILFPRDGFVSGSHAVLSERNGRSFLKDLASSNGTFVKVKQETQLRNGDLFLLGRNLLRIHLNAPT